MKPKLIIFLLVVASGLGAASFAFAHLDYRQREERYFQPQDHQPAAGAALDRTNLTLAIAFGVLSAMVGAAAVGGFAMLFVPHRVAGARE